MNDKREILLEFITLTNVLRRYTDASNAKKYADKQTGTNGWVIAYMIENRDRDIFQRDLEEAFSVRRSTISKILKLMEQKDLVRREGVDYDARLKKLVLTPKALEIQKMMDENFDSMCERAFENLSDEEIENFRSILKKIRKNFE
ncbi:MarR family winged helix-turn-helix transcriptional regulator [Porcipelethomonas sp.]|uniref:MarR family winged helix-turn-helix transcriptional regulator n=1 Tax=Porcipelethomonas sp. TaxID=2981675 RepID=UPI003EF0A423